MFRVINPKIGDFLGLIAVNLEAIFILRLIRLQYCIIEINRVFI